MMEIKVKHSGVVTLQSVATPGAGAVYIAEVQRTIPFAVRRVYFMTGMTPDSVRGNHAHRTLTQAIFAAHGAFTLVLDDGADKQEICMDDPAQGVLLGPCLWATMKEFSSDCVILVLADGYYEESEYIRDYQGFLAFSKEM